jgi:gliding motility-associated-like protein
VNVALFSDKHMIVRFLLVLISITSVNWSFSQVESPSDLTISIPLPYTLSSNTLIGNRADITDPPGFVSSYTKGPDFFFYHKAIADGNIFVNLSFVRDSGKDLLPSLSVWEGKPGSGGILIESVTSIGDDNVDNLLKISFKAIINKDYWIMLDCGQDDGYDYSLFVYNSTVQNACSNIGFESGDFSSWILTDGGISEGITGAKHPIYFPESCISNASLNSSAQHKIMLNGLDAIGGFKKVRPGLGTKSLLLGDSTKTLRRYNDDVVGVSSNGATIEQQFKVTSDNSLFTYYYAVVLEASNHAPNQQPTFRIDAVDQDGKRILCGEYLVVASGAIPGFVRSVAIDDPTNPKADTSTKVLYKDWTPVFIDLTNYIGTSVTIRFTVMDCSDKAHFGYAYVDAVCQKLEITSKSAACNSTKTMLYAPPGGNSYKWTIKGNTTVIDTKDSLEVSPTVSTIYQCEIISVAGCATTLEKTVTPQSKPEIASVSGDLIICINEIDQLTVTATPDATNPWTSSDTDVATIDNTGIILGKKAGTTIISFKSNQGCKRDTTITVNESAVVTGTTSLCKDASTTLFTTISPNGTSPWTSANSAIADVDNIGKVTGKSSGTTDITFLSSNGCKTKVKINVYTTPNTTNPGTIKACDSLLLPSILGTNKKNPNYYNNTYTSTSRQLITGYLKTNQTVWIFDSSGVCIDEKSFTVNLTATPTIKKQNDTNSCFAIALPPLAIGCNYYTGTNKTGTKLIPGDSIKTSQKIYIYAESTTNASCFLEKYFNVNINSSIAKSLIDSSVCDYFVLPNIPNVSYFKGTNQTGGSLTALDTIKTNQKIYAFIAIPGLNGCTSEKPFTITVIKSPVLNTTSDIEKCDSVKLPPTSGKYFTGKLQSGTSKNVGDYITSTQDIYIYAETGGTKNCISEKTQKIKIHITPILPLYRDTSVCDSLVLLPLTTGNYYGATDQGGINYGTSDTIKSSIPIFMYAETGSNVKCKAEKSFNITVKNTPIISRQTPLIGCDSVQLLPISIGKFYTQTKQGGNLILAGTYFKKDTTLFVYAETGGTPNCFSEKTRVITVNKRSVLKSIKDTIVCDTFLLPNIKGTNLTGNEKYFETPKSTLSPAIKGPITSTKTIYIYDSLYTCSDEKSFKITIHNSPKINNPGDQSICDTFKLIKLTGTNLSGNENYYSNSHKKNGVIVNKAITKDTLLFLYDIKNGCAFEDSFKIVIGQKPKISFQADKLKACVPFTATFINASTNIGDSSIWYFGTDSLIVLGDKPVINFTFKEAKCYDVQLKTTKNGCSNSLTKQNMICGNSTPIADFEIEPTIISVLDPAVTFINTSSSDATIYSWDFGDDKNSKEKNPKHGYFGNPQAYVVTLFASNAAKCSSQKSKLIDIIDEFIYYVPNSFTPDGDNLNNTFTPILYSGFDPQSYTLNIFDRWGEILFVSHDPTVGWDGTYGNNVSLVGIYTWTIQVTTSLTKEVKKLHGHVNLIR